MSAEIDWFFDDPSRNLSGDHIEEGELAWAKGFGDGSGIETCVMIEEGVAKIVRASVQVYEDNDGNKMLNVTLAEELEQLPVGEPRIERIMNAAGEMGLMHIRNLGACPANPDMRPAWN